MYKVNEQRMAEWALQAQDCHDSGLSKKDWCQVHGINVNTFYKRVRKLKEYSENKAQALCVQQSKSTFAEVPSIYLVPIQDTERESSVASAIIIETERSIIRISSDASTEQIKAVLRVMKNA